MYHTFFKLLYFWESILLGMQDGLSYVMQDGSSFEM